MRRKAPESNKPDSSSLAGALNGCRGKSHCGYGVKWDEMKCGFIGKTVRTRVSGAAVELCPAGLAFDSAL